LTILSGIVQFALAATFSAGAFFLSWLLASNANGVLWAWAAALLLGLAGLLGVAGIAFQAVKLFRHVRPSP
jgi:hypothetical protein